MPSCDVCEKTSAQLPDAEDTGGLCKATAEPVEKPLMMRMATSVSSEHRDHKHQRPKDSGMRFIRDR